MSETKVAKCGCSISEETPNIRAYIQHFPTCPERPKVEHGDAKLNKHGFKLCPLVPMCADCWNAANEALKAAPTPVPDAPRQGSRWSTGIGTTNQPHLDKAAPAPEADAPGVERAAKVKAANEEAAKNHSWQEALIAAQVTIAEQAQTIERLTGERDSFYMDYRMKADVLTKALHVERDALKVENEKLKVENIELAAEVAACDGHAYLRDERDALIAKLEAEPCPAGNSEHCYRHCGEESWKIHQSIRQIRAEVNLAKGEKGGQHD